MALDKTFLKEHGKFLIGGFALGALLGAGAAGFAVYKSQEPGRQAIAGLAKATADVATCNASLKESSEAVTSGKAALEKLEGEKNELQTQLTDAKTEIEKLNVSIKTLSTKPAPKATPAPVPERKPGSAQPAKRPVHTVAPSAPSRENWEDGL